jgi:hypothetical protein
MRTRTYFVIVIVQPYAQVRCAYQVIRHLDIVVLGVRAPEPMSEYAVDAWHVWNKQGR